MIKGLLKSKGFKLTDSEFAVVMKVVTDDIKFNRTGFKKKTTMKEVITLSERAAAVVARCI